MKFPPKNLISGIKEALSQYVSTPDPQYAIFLKGKWGSGKTYFIRHWMEDYQDSSENTLKEPIYVSLYGLKETKQITTAINQVLYPYLYGKCAKAGKAIGKVLSGLVFKHEVDFDNDENADLFFSMGLDSLSLFNTSDENVSSAKLLIFDDLERSLIDCKELLGYINYFVEHCHCHVIVIGDEKKIVDKEEFGRFKEKTIGREFEVFAQPDEVITAIINESGMSQFVKEHITEITKVFNISDSHNFRVLRQCLWDFSRLYDLISIEETPEHSDRMKSILCTFVATYCEYKGGNHKYLRDWYESQNTYFLLGDQKKETIIKPIAEIKNKYSSYPAFTIWEIFNESLVLQVIDYIDTGNSISDYIGLILKPKENINAWDRLYEVYTMENNQFLELHNDLLLSIEKHEISDLVTLGYVVVYLYDFDRKDIKKLDDRQKDMILESLLYPLRSSSSQEQLVSNYHQVIKGLNGTISESNPELSSLVKEVSDNYTSLLKTKKNRLVMILENLNNSNVGELYSLNKESLPDHSSTYEMAPIFDIVDIEKLFASLKFSNNKIRQAFNSFLRQRYQLSYELQGSSRDTKSEVTNLKLLKTLVDKELASAQMLDKESYRRVSISLSGAIARGSGELRAFN